MACTAWVGRKTNIACVPYSIWSEHPLGSIEAIGCLGLPQSASLASTTLVLLVSKLRRILSGLISDLINIDIQATLISLDGHELSYLYGRYLLHVEMPTRTECCER
jgi:hypothetical protein